MTVEDKNELILADVADVLRRYSRDAVTSAEAVGQILLIIAKKNLEQIDSEGRE